METTETTAEERALAEQVRAASTRATPLRITGGGTRTRPTNGERLSTGTLQGISLYEPGAMTLVVRAGTPVETIDAALAEEGQRLPFEPMDHRPLLGTTGTPTIGGVVAANVSGPRRLQTGACRDHVLGLRFVDGRGAVLKSGGRVMKNVTGLDLGKLLCGSHGALGLITEVALKVMPRPERAATLAFHDLIEAEAADLFCAALRTPCEVSGAAWRGGTAYLRVEGLDIQIRNRLAALPDHLGRAADETLEGDSHDTLWREIRDVEALAGQDSAVWRISTRPTRAAGIAEALRTECGARVQMDWGGARLWAALPDGQPLRDRLDTDSHATLVRPPRTGAHDPIRPPEPPRLAALGRSLRAQFDPAGLFDPDRAAS